MKYKYLTLFILMLFFSKRIQATLLIDSIVVEVCHHPDDAYDERIVTGFIDHQYPFYRHIHHQDFPLQYNPPINTTYFWTNSIYSEYTYDSLGKVLSKADFKIDSNGTFIYLNKFINTYNAQGLISSHTEMVADSLGNMLNVSRNLYTYYASGAILDYQLQSWVSSAWRTDLEDTYSYNGQGSITLKTELAVDSSGVLQNSLKYTYVYNGGNQLTYYKKEHWNSIWIIDEEHSFYFNTGTTIDSLIIPSVDLTVNILDSLNHDSTSTYYIYNSGNWIPNHRILIYYNAYWDDTLKLSENWSGQWSIDSAEHFLIDTIHHEVDYLLQTADSLGNLINTEKDFRHFNQFNLTDSLVVYKWNLTSSTWYFYESEITRYDSLQRVIASSITDQFGWLQYSSTLYDSLGSIIAAHYNDNTGYVSDVNYIYDSNHLLIEESSSSYTGHGFGSSSFCHFYYLVNANGLFIYLPDTIHICYGDTSHLSDILWDESIHQPVTYLWQPNTNISNDTILGPDIYPLVSQNYYFTATDSLGNINRDTIYIDVVQHSPFILDTIGNTTKCSSDTLILFPSQINPLSHYYWYKDQFIFSNNDSLKLMNFVGIGNFFLKVTDHYSCDSYSDTVNVLSYQNPIANIGLSTYNFCTGDTIDLFQIAPDPQTHYQWQLNGIHISSQNDSILNVYLNGNYSLSVIDTITGCSNNSDFDIQFNTVAPSVIGLIGDTLICHSDTLIAFSVFNDSLSSKYWTLIPSASHGGDSILITGNSYINEIILAQYNGQCRSVSDTLKLNVDHFYSNIFASQNPPFCHGDSIELTTTPAFSYLWSTGETSPSIYIDTSGNYSITVVDTLGCSVSSGIYNFHFLNSVQPSITLIGNTLVCFNHALTYHWYLNNVLLIGAVDSAYLPLVNGSYTVQTSDSNGCTLTSSVFYYNYVGTNQVNYSGNVTAIPNPFIHSTMISSDIKNNNQCVLEIINANYSLQKNYLINSFPFELKRDDLPAGIYFYTLVIETDSGTKIFRDKLIIVD